VDMMKLICFSDTNSSGTGWSWTYTRS
jgi:hypothetical protein